MTKDSFERVLSALQEADLHARGETPPGMIVHAPDACRSVARADDPEVDEERDTGGR